MPLPLRRHTDVIRETVPLDGRLVLEVGCGAGRMLGWLAANGASPVGLDPGAEQLARARAAVPGAPLVRGVGEALPFASGRFSLVLFFNSLHHVPIAEQWQAVAEAARVLATGGELLAVEPLAEGDYFDLLRPLDDETEVRKEAYRALSASATLGLRMMSELVYRTRTVEPSWAAVRDGFLAADPARAASPALIEPRLERMFQQLGEPAEGGRAFSQPMRLNLLRRR
jgi:SAM-dependent methyltransferase